MKKTKRFVAKDRDVKQLVLELCRQRCWFICDPLPDDKFEITVKNEERPVKIITDYFSVQWC